MVTGTQALLTGIIGTVATVAMLALTVFPFDHGVVESGVLAGAFVLVALYRTVLDDAFTSS